MSSVQVWKNVQKENSSRKIFSFLKLKSVSHYQELIIDHPSLEESTDFPWFLPLTFEVDTYYSVVIECEWAWQKKKTTKKELIHLVIFTRKPSHKDFSRRGYLQLLCTMLPHKLIIMFLKITFHFDFCLKKHFLLVSLQGIN